MNAELKSKWIAALRSGEYKQCKDTLTDGVGYCCLGVLCRIAGIEISKDDPVIDGRVNPYTPIYNLTGHTPEAHALPHMNDYFGKTFPEIADYIEKNL